MGPPKTETNVAKYSKVLSAWIPTGLVDHFPSVVPATASNVRLSAFPGFMQGGAYIQIRMELPATKAKELYDDASKKAKQFHDGGNFVTLVNERKDGLASTSPHTFDTGTYEFPKDYRVFVLHAESTSQWNHGKSKGVVISLQRNEVIYFAEDW
jgi:hypothetical protein